MKVMGTGDRNWSYGAETPRQPFHKCPEQKLEIPGDSSGS